MPNRLFTFPMFFSAIAFFAVIIAWGSASSFDPNLWFIRFSKNGSITIGARSFLGLNGVDARLEISDEGSFGAPKARVVGLPTTASPDPILKVTGFGDFAGINYRYITWPNGYRRWTFSLSLIYPLAASLILPTIWLIRHRRKNRVRGFVVFNNLAQSPIFPTEELYERPFNPQRNRLRRS